MNQFILKSLRFLINPDGATTKDIATQIAAGKLKTSFYSDFDVKTNQFSPSVYSDIFDYCVDYLERFGEIVTDDIIRNEIINDKGLRSEAKKELIDAITDICEEECKPHEFEYIRKQVQDNYLNDNLVHIAKTAVKQAGETDNPAGALDYVQRNITNLKANINPDQNKLDTTLWLWQFAELKLQEFDETGVTATPCATFGFPKWDMLFGGLFKGEVTVLAGPKNSFKSGLMNRILIHNAMAGKKVVWATKENATDQNWNRLLSFLTGIPLTKINKSDLDEIERPVFRAAMAAIVEAKDNVLLIPPVECGTCEIIKSRIQSYFGNDNPDIIGIDHLGRLKPSGRQGAMWENVNSVCEEMKDMAAFFQCAILTPAHLNRKGNKSEGGADLNDVQFDSISQIMDNLLICKPDLEMPWIAPEPDEYVGKPGILNCTVTRARQAPVGHVFQLEVEPSVSMAQDWKATNSNRPEELTDKRKERLKK